jgi:hypothetical protein
VNCYYEMETCNLYTACSFCIVISFLAVILFILLKILKRKVILCKLWFYIICLCFISNFQYCITSTLKNLQVQVILWLMVSWPVHLSIGPSSGAHGQIFIAVRHLWSCFRVPFLTRRQVYNVLVQFAVTLWSKWPYLTVLFEIPPTWRARFLYLYSLGTGWPSYTSRALSSLFVASYDL